MMYYVHHTRGGGQTFSWIYIPHFIMYMHVTYDWLKSGDGKFWYTNKNRFFAGGRKKCGDVRPQRSTLVRHKRFVLSRLSFVRLGKTSLRVWLFFMVLYVCIGLVLVFRLFSFDFVLLKIGPLVVLSYVWFWLCLCLSENLSTCHFNLSFYWSFCYLAVVLSFVDFLM